jgi:UTP-glucose-1-phosphate uridylyltransferase
MVHHKFLICGNRCLEIYIGAKMRLMKVLNKIVFNKLLGNLLVLNTKFYSGISSIIIITNFVNLVFAQYFDNSCFSIHNMHPLQQNHKLNSKLAASISIRFCLNYLKLISEFPER